MAGIKATGGSIRNDWSEWAKSLNQENIPFCLVSFQQSNDACGSSADHAKELDQLVKQVQNETGQNQVNIVGYSKGGLDARVYLANDPTNDAVANLIMIGTPNAGSEWAVDSLVCRPVYWIWCLDQMQRKQKKIHIQNTIQLLVHVFP